MMKKKVWLYLIIVNLLIFQNIFQQYISIVQYFDEILAAMSIPVICVYVIKYGNSLRIKKINLIIICTMSLLVICGLYSNIRFKYQPMIIILSDLILVLKFFVVYFMAEIILKKDVDKYGKMIVNNLKIIIVVFMGLTILNYVSNIFPVDDIRYGIKSNQLFYSHPTLLAAICIFILASYIRYEKKINSKYVFLIIFVILTTLRLKAIGGIAIIFMMALYVDKKNKKITLTKWGILALICVALAYQQIEYYFIIIDDSARAMLASTSVKIANNYFPLGTGFGTYGSYFSVVEYSPIYTMYGLDKTYGLVKGRAFFASDNFWPMILGQFGYLGIILYCIAIYMIYLKIQKSYKIEDKYIYISKMICLAYLMISSSSESAFVNSFAIPMAILLAM